MERENMNLQMKGETLFTNKNMQENHLIVAMVTADSFFQ